MNVVYLLLGSNLNDRVQMLRSARELISERIGRITHESSVYESEPWGFQTRDIFLNQAIRLETACSPASLLEEILHIEHDMGRKRVSTDDYISRPIDVDILFFNDEVIDEEGLTIPHPRIPERMFALMPLQELNRHLVHPAYRKTISELVLECTDPLRVELYRP